MSDLEGLQHYHSDDALTEYDRFGMRVYPPARIASDLTALAYTTMGEPPAPTVEERIATIVQVLERIATLEAQVRELTRRLDESEGGK